MQKKVIQDHKIKVDDRLYLLLILLEFDLPGGGKLTDEFVTMIVANAILPACFSTNRSCKISFPLSEAPKIQRFMPFRMKSSDESVCSIPPGQVGCTSL